MTVIDKTTVQVWKTNVVERCSMDSYCKYMFVYKHHNTYTQHHYVVIEVTTKNLSYILKSSHSTYACDLI